MHSKFIHLDHRNSKNNQKKPVRMRVGKIKTNSYTIASITRLKLFRIVADSVIEAEVARIQKAAK